MPAAFRRSVEGEKAIKQQMRQLFRLAEDKFSEKPLVNQKGEFTIPGLEGIPKGSLKPLGTDGTAASASSAASKPS